MKEVYIQKITDALGEQKLENYAKLLSRISEEYAHVNKGYQAERKSLRTADKLIPFTNQEAKTKIKEQRLACNKLATSYYGMLTSLKKEIQTCAENQMPFRVKFSMETLTKSSEHVIIKEHMSERELGTSLRRVKISGLEELHASIDQLKTILSEELGNIYEHCPEREELFDWVLTDFFRKHNLPAGLEKFF